MMNGNCQPISKTGQADVLSVGMEKRRSDNRKVRKVRKVRKDRTQKIICHRNTKDTKMKLPSDDSKAPIRCEPRLFRMCNSAEVNRISTLEAVTAEACIFCHSHHSARMFLQDFIGCQRMGRSRKYEFCFGNYFFGFPNLSVRCLCNWITLLGCGGGISSVGWLHKIHLSASNISFSAIGRTRCSRSVAW